MLRSHRLKSVLAGGVCAMALAGAAQAEIRTFNVPAGELQAALDSYARQSGVQLLGPAVTSFDDESAEDPTQDPPST